MSMNRDNFRANQPPSKVLHIRNLPPDATEQDIVDLCKPFGRIIKAKLNAGQAKTGNQSNQGNQAFLEFENVNCAINMIYSFVGSADPPKVRNKTVYLQYSTRQEIGSGNWGGGGGADHQPAGNVVLIIMDNIQVALGPTLDTVHMLCAAFGEVAKIAMFEKASGLQALVQFKDGRHAKEAQQTLDGTSIPEHLVPSHPGKITMKVSFSAHPDLSIRSQSERSRDFSLPYHPDGSGQAAAAGMGASAVDPHGAAGSSNVLLCMIDDVAYTPSVEALHQVFSTYGYVQKLTVFEKSGNWQALVQYPDDGAAGVAKQSLDGYSMYPGGKNKLKLSFSTHRDLSVWVNNERNWDFTVAPGGPAAAAAAAAASSAASRSAAAAAAGEGGGGSGSGGAAAGPSTAAEAQAEAAAGGSSSRPASAAAGPSSRQQQDLNAPVTGMDYEHAHNEAARIAIEALGDSMTCLPSHSGGPRTMLPHPRGSRPHYGGGPGGYGPGPPPPAYGYPPGGYGYPPYGGYPPEYPPYGY